MSDEKDDPPSVPPSGDPPSGNPPSGDPPSDEDVKALVKRALASAKSSAKAEAEAEDSPPSEDPPTSEDPGDDGLVDEVDLKDALRGALRPPAGAVAPSLLRGVQRKLRVRSRGKFYGDGWSTAPSPRSTYLISSILMLLLVAFVFFALVPWSSAGLP